MPTPTRTPAQEVPCRRTDEALHRCYDEEECDGRIGRVSTGERVGGVGEEEDEEVNEGEEAEEVGLDIDCGREDQRLSGKMGGVTRTSLVVPLES